MVRLWPREGRSKVAVPWRRGDSTRALASGKEVGDSKRFVEEVLRLDRQVGPREAGLEAVPVDDTEIVGQLVFHDSGGGVRGVAPASAHPRRQDLRVGLQPEAGEGDAGLPDRGPELRRRLPVP